MTSISASKLDELISELERRVRLEFAGVCYTPKTVLSIAVELKRLREVVTANDIYITKLEMDGVEK